MTTMQEREVAPRGMQAGFLEELAERLTSSANTRAVFGEPVERDGVTIIPVATVRWGFGGGSGRQREGEEGTGGGGGMIARPVGYVELKGGEASFHAIREAPHLTRLIAAAGVAGWLILRGIRKLRGM